MILFGHDRAVADWVASQSFGKPFCPPFSAMGVLSGGRLTGGLVFTGYTGESVDLSVAGRGVVSRPVLAAVVAYVFGQLGCVRLAAHTSAENRRVRRILPHLGFKFEGTARRMYGDHDGYAYSLTADDLPAFRRRWKI